MLTVDDFGDVEGLTTFQEFDCSNVFMACGPPSLEIVNVQVDHSLNSDSIAGDSVFQQPTSPQCSCADECRAWWT